eukprot:3377107-Rhodomonas_salina.6
MSGTDLSYSAIRLPSVLASPRRCVSLRHPHSGASILPQLNTPPLFAVPPLASSSSFCLTPCSCYRTKESEPSDSTLTSEREGRCCGRSTTARGAGRHTISIVSRASKVAMRCPVLLTQCIPCYGFAMQCPVLTYAPRP